ncbi:alpha/beta hydrolase [Streptomyces sp. NPDC059076]|uniref:alpha/beta hydrolase n=1 Tax=unclassified Streptomyces TaxID=2593676 RepID=UPI0036814320
MRGSPRVHTAVAGCIGWPGEVNNPQHRLRITDAPAILMSHALHDPANNHAWAADAHRQNRRTTVLLTYEGSGHSVYNRNTCTRRSVDDDLLELKVPPHGSRCAATDRSRPQGSNTTRYPRNTLRYPSDAVSLLHSHAAGSRRGVRQGGAPHRCAPLSVSLRQRALVIGGAPAPWTSGICRYVVGGFRPRSGWRVVHGHSIRPLWVRPERSLSSSRLVLHGCPEVQSSQRNGKDHHEESTQPTTHPAENPGQGVVARAPTYTIRMTSSGSDVP